MAIPQYTGAIKGIDLVVLDTLIYTNAAALKPFTVTVQKSYVGTTPCEPHGTNVAEIVAQALKTAQTDLKILNFAVFDCNGSSSTSIIAQAVKDIIAYKKGIAKDRN